MAKKTQTSNSPVLPRSAKGRKRPTAAHNKRTLNRLVIGAGVLFALVIALVIFVSVRRSLPVDGQETFQSQGNTHIEANATSAFTYNSIPPTSGPHYAGMVNWGVSLQPLQYEYLLHNLEDGGVVIYRQCPDGCEEIGTALEHIVQPYVSAGRRLVLVPNDPSWTSPNGLPLHKDMGAKIAVTAWGTMIKMDEVDENRIRTFIENNEGMDRHAG